MEKVTLTTKSFDLGGAEKLAVLYSNLINEISDFSLVVYDDYGKENKLLDELNKEIKFDFLVNNKIVEKMIFYRNNRKRKFKYRVLYDLSLTLRKFLIGRNLKKKIKNKEGYIIDFLDMVPYKMLDKNFISWIHYDIVINSAKQIERMRKRYEKVKYVIVTGEIMKKEFLNYFPEFSEKVKVIKNPFDFETIRVKGEAVEKLTEDEKAIIDKKFILACSRLDKKSKDIPTLMKAFASSKVSEDKLLVVVGHGQQQEELEELIEKLNCKNKILLLGKKTNPYIWMKNCEYFVHSSKMEGFGMVLVEAMCFSKLVVASDCSGGPREILRNGEAGILFETGNISELRKILDEIENNKIDIEEKIKVANSFLNEYSTKTAQKKLVELLK